MKKRKRDAKTGFYISDEEAALRDPSTWIEQTEFDKAEFLKKVFKKLEKKVSKTVTIKDNRFLTLDEDLILTLKEIKEVFTEEYGCDFDK